MAKSKTDLPKSSSKRNQLEMMETLDAFGVNQNNDDVRTRSYSLPAGDLSHLKKKCRKVRFVPLDGNKQRNGSDQLISSDQDLPQLLEAFGISPPKYGRKGRSYTIGPSDKETVAYLHQYRQDRKKQRGEELLANLSSNNEGDNSECLAILEAFGVIQKSAIPQRRRCFTVPFCDFKRYMKHTRAESRSTLSLPDEVRYSYLIYPIISIHPYI